MNCLKRVFTCCFVSITLGAFTVLPVRAEVHNSVFTGSISLDGDISDFFDGAGVVKSGVCVSNDPAGSISGVPGSAGLGEPPLAATTTKDNLVHPSGFNQRRIMSAYNPALNGGTVFIGIDLPGGSNAANGQNPDYADSLIPVRGSIRPFDADANGEPETIGRKLAGGTLDRCGDAVAGDTLDTLNCAATDTAGFTDNATDNGVAESYTATLSFTNGIVAQVSLIEDAFSGAGLARVVIVQTAGKTFGAMASINGSGAPLGFDVEFAITNVNANVDACTRLLQIIGADSGSNRDGVSNGEDHNDIVCQYVLPASVTCQVLFYTNNVQVTQNLCDAVQADAGVIVGSTVELRVAVCAGGSNAQDVNNISVNIPGVGNVVIAGPLSAGQCATTTVGTVTCDMPGSQGFMASVSAQGAITANCTPINTDCSGTLECCGTPNIKVIKQIACVLSGGTCGTFGKSATGVKDDADPAFCYSITVTNTGNVGLHNITVVDDQLGDLSASYADTLPVNGSENHIFKASHNTNTMNTVQADGEGDFSTGHVMSTDNANAIVIQASISCTKYVTSPDDQDGNANDSHVTLLADGNSHNVSYSVTVMAGNADLANVVIADAALGCQLPPAFSLKANASTNITLCTVPTICQGAGSFTNTISITADIDTSGGVCGFDSNGQHISVNTSCQAVVDCLSCPTVTVNDATICEGGSAQLCATPHGGSGVISSTSWTGPNNFTASTPCITVSAAGQYCATVTDADGCVSPQGCGTLTVNQPPTCSITGNDTICVGQSTEFCGPAGMKSYSWTGPGNFTASTQCTGPISDAGQYNLTIVSQQDCTNNCSRTLIVNQLPPCTITGNGTICTGSTSEFCGPAGAGLSYLWNGPEKDGATSQCITIGTAGTYHLRVINSSGCTNTCQNDLIVNDNPPCDITGNGTICAGQSTEFCGPAGAGLSYLWTGPEKNNATTQCITISTTGTYHLRVIAAGNCTNTCQKDLVVNPIPPCTITGNGTICDGQTSQFCGPDNLTYLWSGPEKDGATSQCITIGTAGTYTLRVINTSGCTNSCQKDLIVNPVPVCQINGSDPVCNGTTNTYTASSSLTGSSFSWQISGNGAFVGGNTGASVQVRATAIGGYTLTVTVSKAGCTNSCQKMVTTIDCTPCIAVKKLIACALDPNTCSDFGPTATGYKSASQNPSFCYSITISNCGVVALSNIQVNDNVLGNLTSLYPSTLAVGQTASAVVHHSNSTTTTNTVTATGHSDTGDVSAQDKAVAIVIPASVSCSETASSPDDIDGNPNDNHVTLPGDGLDHSVTYCATISAGASPLVNVVLSNSSATGCNAGPFAMAANTSTTICCTVTLNCSNIPPEGVSNSMHVTADVTECGHDSAGNQISVSSDCSALVVCQAPAGCRTTGGGKQPRENTCPQVAYVTHGGQVGAPFAQASAPNCANNTGFNNPCIRGEYQHVRHGGQNGNFHAASNGSEHDFDSLMCACLPCDHVDIASPFGGCHPADRVYAGANPLSPGKHFGLCNPGDKICGPEPRKAPANKICFSGVGDYVETKGKRTENKVVFRVDLEDRSEPGGAHPKGGKAPPDRYRMRMWIIDATQVDSAAVKALRATVACKDALTEQVPTTLDCLGTATPAPDIDDGGDLDRGNRQIHPNTGATCN